MLKSRAADKSCDARERIELAMKRSGGKKAEAAALLGCSRITLLKKLKRYSLATENKGIRRIK